MKLTESQHRKYFEARLRGQRLPSGAQGMFRCPFHDDRTPSLSINFEKGTWTCHGGCGSGGLFDFEEQFTKCDRETARAEVAQLLGEKQFSFARREPEAGYRYTDASGKLAAEKQRFRRDDGSKYFQWRRPDGKGGFEYKLNGFKAPLYRLHEVIAATYVLVVEGEKCADAVAQALKNHLKVAVTTSPDGASKCGQAPKWSQDFSEYLKGKTVCFLPDNDEPGRAHMEAAAVSAYSYAFGVKVVLLPGLQEHGDVYDYLQSHTADDLLALIEQAPQWRPPASASTDFFIGALDFAKMVPDEIEWLVKGVIPRGWNGAIIADPKSLKSYSTVDLLISLALGQDWLGFEVPRRVRTAILAREDSPGLTGSRIKLFLRGKAGDPALFETFNDWMKVNSRKQTATWALDNDEDVRLVIDRLKAAGTELLALDVFRKMHFADENDNTEMQGILDRVGKIQAETGCAIAIVHHTNKSGPGSVFYRSRGASTIHGFMEWGIGFTTINPDDPPKERIRKMEFLSKAGCEPDPIFVRAEGGEDVGVIRLVKLQPDQLPSPKNRS